MAIKPIKKTCTSGSAHENKPCGQPLTEVPFSKRDGTKLVQAQKTLEWIDGSGARDTGYVSFCKDCDGYTSWPRAK